MSQPYRSLADFEPWEVEAYLDGEDLPHLAEFLARNPAAAAALRREQAQQRRLQSTLYRFDCPSPATLQAYAWGELPAHTHQAVAHHLQQCPQCSGELAARRAFAAEALPMTAAQPAPSQPGLLEQLQGLAEQVRLVVATLVTPRGPQLAGVALRSAAATATATPMQLLFEADNTDVSLLIQQGARGAYRIDGQLFAPAALTDTYFTLAGATPDALPLTGAVTATGAFTQTDLPAGVYQLIIKLPDRAIVIPNLTLS
ncbi:MAG: hypothetical protein DYG89_26405 [Caldilinea sp. CFX5]|nr:hypothetical protein [Caldilinea sp. CFX5]